MLGVQIRHGKGDVTIGFAERIGVFAVVIDREFELEFRFRRAQIDQGEAIERIAVRHRHVKSVAVEIHGP